MALIRWRSRRDVWDPFKYLADLQEDMNRLFDLSLARLPREDVGGVAEWLPAVDIVDEKDRVRIKADLPGVNKDDVDIRIEDGVLSIKGERKEEKEEKDKNFYRKECFYGSFERSVALPAEVDANKAEASYKDGVLEIILPKKEESKPKQIKLKVK